jgi:hypothetical protein
MQCSRGPPNCSSNQPLVFIVPPDPKPHEVHFALNRNSPMMQSDARRPESTDPLEMQRRMARIVRQQFETRVRLASGVRR